jgi:hypothetical protein
LVLPILLFATNARADSAETELTMSIVAFGQGDLAKAREHLDAAQQQTTDPVLLGKVNRQRGIIDSVEGKNLAAVVSFMRALYFDPKTELDPREHQGEVQRQFDCAYQLKERGLSEKAVEVRYAEVFSKSNWECPAAEAPPPPPTSQPPPPPRVETDPEPPYEEEPPPRPEKDMGPLWKSPVLWISVVSGVVVLGAATATGLIVARDEPFTGSTNTNVVLRR